MTVVCMFQPHHLVADLPLPTSGRDICAPQAAQRRIIACRSAPCSTSPRQGRFPIRDRHLAVFVERAARRLVRLSRRHRPQPSDPGTRRFERSPTEFSALISMDLGRSRDAANRHRQTECQKRNGRPDGIARTFPLSVAQHLAYPRFTPYLGVAAAKHCVSTTQSATLRGLLRHATVNSAIHTVVPRKAHLSRLDPPKRPP